MHPTQTTVETARVGSSLSGLAILAGAVACLALLSATSCSLIDGLSGSDEPGIDFPDDPPPDGLDCTIDDDCSIVDEACSTNGCVSFPTRTFGACFSDADCNGASSTDLVCPRGECSCLERVQACVIHGRGCLDNIECTPLEFCHRETGRCLRPYQCTTHSDCLVRLCAAEGCISEAQTSRGLFCSSDADCPADAACLSARCFANNVDIPCQTSAECGPGAFCAFETETCMQPVEGNAAPAAIAD